MWGLCKRVDERGVSEIYGTVLIISLTFLVAIVLAGLGYYAIDGLSTETEDSISQDSFDIMDERITEVTGSSIDASSEFMIPDGDGKLTTKEDDGYIDVTVTSSVDSEFLEATSQSVTRSATLGSVRYEGEDVTAYWQGGGLWQKDQGAVSLSSSPGLTYDGESLSVGLTKVSGGDAVKTGDTIHVSQGDDGFDLNDVVDDLMVIDTGENQYTHEVDVELEIQTSFPEAWATYALEGMTEPPENIDELEEIDETDEIVRMKFTDIGPGVSFDYKIADFEDYEEDGIDVLYSGSPSNAPLNEVIETGETGDFYINETSAEQEIGDYDNIFVAQYDFETGGETAEDIIFSNALDHQQWQTGGGDPPDTTVHEQNGLFEYEFEVPQQICVIADTGEDGQGNRLGEIRNTLEADEDHRCFDEAADEPPEPRFDVRTIGADADSVVIGEDELSADTLDWTIQNRGGDGADDIVFRVGEADSAFGEGGEIGASQVDSFVITEGTEELSINEELDSTESSIDFELTENQLQRVVDEFGTELELKVDTNGYSNSTTMNVSEPAAPTFEIEDLNYEIELDASEGFGQSELLVDAEINNTGEKTDSDRVNLYLDEEGTVVDSTVVEDLDGGDSEEIAFSWVGSELDSDENATFTVETTDDEKSFAINRPNLVIDHIAFDYDETEEEVDVEYTVENTGEAPTEQSVLLSLDEQASTGDADTDQQPQSISVDPGEMETGAYEAVPVTDPGELVLNVSTFDDYRVEGFTVDEPLILPEITGVNQPTEGEAIEIAAEIENVGQFTGSADVTLSIDEFEDQTAELSSLGASEIEEIEYTIETERYQDGQVSPVDFSVNTGPDVDTGTVEIDSLVDPQIESFELTNDDTDAYCTGWLCVISDYAIDVDIDFEYEISDPDDGFSHVELIGIHHGGDEGLETTVSSSDETGTLTYDVYEEGYEDAQTFDFILRAYREDGVLIDEWDIPNYTTEE